MAVMKVVIHITLIVILCVPLITGSSVQSPILKFLAINWLGINMGHEIDFYHKPYTSL